MTHPGSDAQNLIPPPTRRPGGHWGLVWRTPEESDIAGMADLVRRYMQAERLIRLTSPGEITVMVHDPRVTTLVGVDREGRHQALAAVARTQSDYLATGMVGPDYQGMGIGRALVTWQVATFRELTQLHGHSQIRLQAVIDDAHVSRRRLHAAAGFTQHRSVLLMSREVQPIHRAPAPGDGLHVRSFSAAQSGDQAQAWDEDLVLAFDRARETFVGTRDAGRLNLCGLSSRPTPGCHDPSLSLAAVDGAGEVRGALLSSYPVLAPHLASALLDPAQVHAWTQADSELFAADGGPMSAMLLQEAHLRMAQAGVNAHLIPIDVSSPLRETLHEVGYGVRGTQTRSVVTITT